MYLFKLVFLFPLVNTQGAILFLFYFNFLERKVLCIYLFSFIYFSIFGCAEAGSSLLHAGFFSQVVESRGYSSLLCLVFPLLRLLLLWSVGSRQASLVVVVNGLSTSKAYGSLDQGLNPGSLHW